MLASTPGQLALSVFAQLIRYGAPLLIYPILIRDLSTEHFAAYVVFIAAGQTIGQFTEFGFGLSTVRELTQRSSAPRQAAIACGEVLFGKAAMFLLVTIVYFLATWRFGHLFGDARYNTIPLLIGIAYGFTPNWFYIGIGRAHVLALAELATSACQLLLVIAFVNAESGYVGAIAATVVPVAALALLGQVHAIRTLSIVPPTLSDIWRSAKKASHFFIATNGPSLTNRVLLIILGMSSPAAQVAAYAAGERIVSAAVGTLAPVMRVLVPKVVALHAEAPRSAKELAARAFWVAVTLYGLASLSLAATAHAWTTWVFGPKLAGFEPIIAFMLVVVPLSAMSRIIGLLILVPAKKESQFNYLTLAICAAGLAAAFPLASAGALPMVGLRVAIEAGIAGGCVFLAWRSARSMAAQANSEGMMS